MSKEIKYSADARASLKEGVDTLADLESARRYYKQKHNIKIKGIEIND